MLETIVKQEIIFYAMGILMVLGIFAKFVSHFTVRRMVKAAGEIQKSNHRLMKLIKAKFEHASMISDRVQNVEAFVDKYIYEYKVFGIRLAGWRSFPRKVLWLIGLLGVFAIFESYRMDGVSDLMMQYVRWTGIFVMGLFLLGFVAEEQTRLNAARNYMVEYLENVCIHRYARLNHAAGMSDDEVQSATDCGNSEENKEAGPGDAPQDDEVVLLEPTEIQQDEEKTNEQQMRIRAILEEFLA